MPHHWNKLRVEEMLFSSGLDGHHPAAHQPTMQNIMAEWDRMVSSGYLPDPCALPRRNNGLVLSTSSDVAEAAATSYSPTPATQAPLTNWSAPSRSGQIEVAEYLWDGPSASGSCRGGALSRAGNSGPAHPGMDDYSRETPTKMFRAYARVWPHRQPECCSLAARASADFACRLLQRASLPHIKREAASQWGGSAAQSSVPTGSAVLPKRGPTIWIPTGNPSLVLPAGTLPPGKLISVIKNEPAIQSV